MNPKLEIESSFLLLKAHLKNKGISYRELASKLSMSESNLKRIFSTYSCSFEQMAEICEASGITMFDLISSAAKQEVTSFSLTDEAEDFFVDNLDHFIFYRNLAAAPDINVFLDNLKIPKSKIDDYIKSLVKLKLLSYENKRLVVNDTGYLRFSNNTKFSSKLFSSWVPWFFNKIIKNENNENYTLKTMSTGLSKTHKDQLLTEIHEIMIKYSDMGSRDQQVGAGVFESVGVCIGVGPHRIGFFEGSF